MLSKRFSFSLLILMFILVIQVRPAHADPFFQPDQKETAIDWFNNGQFDKALPVFSALCFNFPYDYLVKYYYGACLIETGSYSLDAEKNLLLSSTGEVPVKVNYYLGRFYHANRNWNSALRYYNRFKNYGKESEIADLRVDELSKLCYSQVNPFITEKVEAPATSESRLNNGKVDQPVTPVVPVISEKEEKKVVDKVPVPTDTIVKVIVKSSQTDSLTSKQLNDSLHATLPDTIPIVSTRKDTVKSEVILPKFIDFQINDKVTYLIEDMFQVADAKNEFRMAANQEKQLDSLLQVVQNLRKLYHNNIKPVIRDSLAAKIQDQEYRNMLLNAEVDQHYGKARKMEQEWWKDADYSIYENFMTKRDSLIRLQTIPPVVVVIPDTIVVAPVDSVALKNTGPINDKVTSPEKVDENEISYRIQIGAYDKMIPAQRKVLFNKLEKIRTIDKFVNDEGVTVYTTGNLKNFDDAAKLQTQIRQEGIKDAFVIALKNGKRVPLPEVKQKTTR